MKCSWESESETTEGGVAGAEVRADVTIVMRPQVYFWFIDKNRHTKTSIQLQELRNRLRLNLHVNVQAYKHHTYGM